MYPSGFNREYTDEEFYFRFGKPALAVRSPPEGSEIVWLGIDDTDSADLGMCTTYLCAVLVERIADSPIDIGLWDLPLLVRLNPQVPYKTRGNGAVALRLFVESGEADAAFELARHLISELAVLEDGNTHPGLVMMVGENRSRVLADFYGECLHRIVEIDEALEVVESQGLRSRGWKRGLGQIGAAAAIGADLSRDQTFELIAYREPWKKAPERDVDPALVMRVDREVEGTFFNYDYQNRKVCIVPRSPCPVRFGIRGETPSAVRKGFSIVDSGSPSALLFRTNQHTDAHIERVPGVSGVKAYSSVRLRGSVSRGPRTIEGGHVILSIKDDSGEVDCAAYEPTKQFRDAIRRLIPGDVVVVYGSVRPPQDGHGPTVNLEKIQVVSVVERRLENPFCPRCGSRLKSMGASGGFKCKNRDCGFRDSEMKKVEVPLARELSAGSFYEPPPVAWRHLYMPISRLG
jgi:tRNA(Ile2)-agmatinylcytidine synthase